MLERELAELVSSGQVKARIDSHAKVLYARLTDARAAAYDHALKFGRCPVLTSLPSIAVVIQEAVWPYVFALASHLAFKHGEEHA